MYGSAYTSGTYSDNGTATVGDWPYGRSGYVHLRVLVSDYDWPHSNIFDEFYEALKRCHDALADLLRPWLRSLRQPRRGHDLERLGRVPLPVIAPGRCVREVRHRRGVFNFYKIA